MSRHSHVSVPAEKARKMADELLQRIYRSRERKLAEYLAGETKRVNTQFLRKLFRRKPVTEADITTRENRKSPWNNRVWKIQDMYYSQENLALKVIEAARHGDPLLLSLDDIDDLTA